MKNILTFALLFISLFASSQTQFLGAPNTTIVVKGNMKVDSILYLPKRSKTPTDTGALRYQISDSSLYVWTGNAWRKAKNDGTVTSVGLTMPTAFAVANSPVTTSGTLAVTATGSATEYIRGDGTLGTLPTSGGGGGSGVNYYLNGSVSQGTIGGSTYYEMSKTPIVGAGTNFTAAADGLMQQFITDAGDPNRLLIPAGAWNFELYFSASSAGGTPTFYVELLKYDGTTFTSISSSSASPQAISNGTTKTLYFTSLAVSETVLLATDRLAIRVYVNVSGRTITFYTEDANLAEIITTFAGGIVSLNGLTANDQFFATGTSGSDFNISSTSATHTFNLPTASSTVRGALSSTDWSTFNNKVNISDTAAMLTNYIRHAGYGLTKTGQALSVDTSAIATRSRVQKGIDSVASVRVGGTGTLNYIPKWSGTSTQTISQIFDNGTNVGIGATSPNSKLEIYAATAAQVGLSVYTANETAERTTYSASPALQFSSYQSAAGGPFTKTSDIVANADGTVPSVMRLWTKASGASTPSERMRITAAGDVAIGNTSPAYKLDVTGTLRNTTGAAFATSSGNVLVGTTTDGGYKFQVNGGGFYTTPTYTNTSDLGLVVASGGNVPGINLRTASTGRFSIASNYNRSNSTTFLTGTGTNNPTNEIMVIDHTTRNVQIGSDAAAAYRLDIAGDLRTTTGANFATSSGNVVVGGTGTGGAKVDITGDLRTSGQTILATTSGNIGLSVTPSAWSTIRGVLETGSGVHFFGTGTQMQFGSNSYYDGSNYIYKVTDRATRYLQNTSVGSHIFQYAASGTAGTAVTYLTAATISTVGNLILSSSFTDAGYKLDVDGRVRIRTIDSTGTGINMLYADANGVIKKAAVPSGGGGSVTSITAGTGLTGGTITTSGTIAVDTASIATRARVQKGIDSVTTLANTKLSGTGISGYFPKWTGSTTQDTSQLFQLGRNIGIGIATPTYRIHLPDAGNTANQAMIAGSIFGSDGNGQTIAPSSGAMAYYGQGSDGYIYGAQSSGGKWGVNTRSVSDAVFNVNGNVKIVTIDSTSTARNMLYQDANGVIKKAQAITLLDDVMTASGSWVPTKDAGSGVTINNVAYTTNGTTKMVTIDGNFYIASASFSDGAWNEIGTIPAAYRPSKTVNWNSNFIVSGAEYERSDNTDFTGALSWTYGQMRIKDDGKVEVNASVSSNSIAAGGTAYIIVTFTQSYIIK